MIPAQQLTRLIALESAAPKSKALPDVLAGAFPEQRAFIEDPSHLKWAFCTRRAAKSYSVGLEHVDSVLKHGSKHLYIGLTRESARAIMWEDVLKAIDDKHQIGLKFNETRLEARAANGGTIRLLGMDSNEKEKRKALGQKYRKVAVDEAQDFHVDLRQLVYGVLKPSVADYRGSISLTGTPANLAKGLFFDLTNGKEPGWSGHRWDTYANPYMADKWDAEIKALKASNPLVVETAWFRQMYQGLWVIEQDQLVYRFNPSRNVFNGTLPVFRLGGWHYVLGCDLGYNDPTAFVVWAYHDHDRRLFALESKKEAKLDITDVAQRIKAYQKRYDFDAMVVDGANKQAVEEIRRRHDIPLRAADKTGKSDFIEVMNGEMVQANILVNPATCQSLIDEWQGLIWDERAAKREEHPNCENHLCFIAGTQVETASGPRPIETIAPGDMVWTRKGLRAVQAAAQTGVREVLRLTTAGGRSLTGTTDHPVWTEAGWRPLATLTPDDMLTAWRGTALAKESSMTGSLTGGIPNPSAETSGSTMHRSAASDFIGPFGKSTTGRSLRGIISTTWTAIRRITISPIWNASRPASTYGSTRAVRSGSGSPARPSSTPSPPPPHGTDPRRESPGIANTPAGRWPIARFIRAIALFAGRASGPRPRPLAFAGRTVAPRSAEMAVSITSNSPAQSAAGSSCATGTTSPAVAPDRVLRVEGTGRVLPVFNLTVESEHEYFANGILVSNCDAALYGWRYCYQYLSEREAPQLDPSEAMEKAAEVRYIEAIRAQQEESDDWNGGWGEAI